MFGSTDIKTFTEIQDITIKTLFGTGIVKHDTPLVVACSGGPDSTALLHVLFNSSEIILENVLVAHLNHDFRGQEAEDDAEFVKNMIPVPRKVPFYRIRNVLGTKTILIDQFHEFLSMLGFRKIEYQAIAKWIAFFWYST